jgi:UDP-glucose 4-epimerase
VQNKRILITGGLGFIGFHAVQKWQKENWDILIIDDLSSNIIDPSNNLLQNTKIIISDIKSVTAEQIGNIDLILHCAAPNGTIAILDHAGNIVKTIIDDAYWAINMSKEKACPIIFISTSEVYGDHNGASLSEDSEKILQGSYIIRDEYSHAKLLSEIILSSISKIDPGFRYQVIRPFNVVGKYQKYQGGHVLPRFVKQALNNEPITVYFNGLQHRAFTWVQDAVNAIYLTSITKEHWNHIWNIGNENNKFSILELSSLVKNLTNSQSEILFVNPKELHGNNFDDSPEKIPNSQKIRTLLNWNTTKNVKEIVQEVIEYYNEK